MSGKRVELQRLAAASAHPTERPLSLALCLEDDPDLTSVCAHATGDALAQLLVRKRRLKPEDREPPPGRSSSSS